MPNHLLEKVRFSVSQSATGLSSGLMVAGLLMASTSAYAQVPPDAGTLQREGERNLQAPTVSERQVTAVTRPMAEAEKGSRIKVKKIVIAGASLLPVAELDPLVADRIGQSLTLAELEQAAQRIAEHYRQRGWFVRVYLPQQDVTDGVVRIEILEGRFGGSRLENKGLRTDGKFAQGIVTHRLRAGQPLSASELERGLLLANDLPGIRATGLLEAGDVQGETRLVIQTNDEPFITGDIGVSNYGIKATGRTQLSGGVSLNNLAGIGDQLSLRGVAAEHIGNALLRYSVPLGYDGLRLAAHVSTLSYELRDRFKPLDADGKAQTAGVTLSYPLVRQRDRNLSIAAAYEQRRYDDDMLSAAIRRHRINAFTVSLSGDRRDSLFGGGAIWGGVELTHGDLDIRDIAGDKAADAAGPKTQGNYSKLGFNLNRLQAIGASKWQLMGALSGQISSGNLGSSEHFALGGPSRVRAYPVNEASGDQGLLFKLELQRSLPYNWQAIAFFDTGRIQQHKNTWAGWQGGGKQPNTYSLSGAGVGLNWKADGWVFSASAAVPVDSNPGRDVNGKNNDGSKASSAQYWFSLNRIF